MNRFSFVAVMALVSACGVQGQDDDENDDRQSNNGSGGGSSSNGGSALPGFGTPGSPSSSSSRAGQPCKANSECDSGDTCLVDKAYSVGICIKHCESASGPDKSKCGSASCIGDTANAFCLVGCTRDSDCPTAMECNTSSGTTKGCAPRRLSVTGSACTADDECGDGLQCGNLPGGYCTALCGTSSLPACRNEATCVTVSDEGAACMLNCATPGTQSSCRTGYTCVGLQGQSTGVCAPKQ